MNDIDIDLARPKAGSFAAAWPKIVTAPLPGGGTARAAFHTGGRSELTDNAPRVGLSR